MSDEFDPHHEWLGVAPSERPPHHYRLLGVPPFESNPRVIENAADRQMAFVQTFKTGPHSAESQRLLNELSAARLCLLNADKKAAYDAELRARLAPTVSPGLARALEPARSAPRDAPARVESSVALSREEEPRAAETPAAAPEPTRANRWATLVAVLAATASVTLAAGLWIFGSDDPASRSRASAAGGATAAAATTHAVVGRRSVAEREIVGGYAYPDVIDASRATTPAVIDGIDFRRSWALRLDAFIHTTQPEWQMLLMWGDDRFGKDPFWLRIEQGRLTVGLVDVMTDAGVALRADAQPGWLHRWLPIAVEFDATTRVARLIVDGKVVARHEAATVPTADRPMPWIFGGINPTQHRFLGQIRDVRFGNVREE